MILWTRSRLDYQHASCALMFACAGCLSDQGRGLRGRCNVIFVGCNGARHSLTSSFGTLLSRLYTTVAGTKYVQTVHRGEGDDNDVGEGMRGMMNHIT